MNQAEHKTTFETSEGTMLALEGMNISGVLQNAFAVVEIVQTYRNTESSNIEAVYSFPLPVEATLLHLSVRLNETLLLGQVAERKKAEAKYEEAVASGDTAVMLEQVEPGLYTMNVGNLLANERAEVKLRYALPLKWEGQRLRLALPTTIAPRYGDQKEAGVQPHQAPEPDLMTEHTYALALQILGSLGDAVIASPSHAISVQKLEQGLEVGIAGGRAYADRDLVLTLQMQGEPSSAVAIVPDGEGHIAHAAFRIPEGQAQQKVVLKILVDCSGSMAGDSIDLARAGVLHALNSLQLGDSFSVSAFGSTVEHDPRFRGRLMPGCVDSTIRMASDYVGRLDATMGGTEMLTALEAVFALNKNSDKEHVEGGDVLLITDGETWDRSAIVQACRKSGHRIFVIGIGSSPTESVVREVAESTGGAAAFVSPREAITPVVERHLHRMRVPRVTSAQLDLPGEIVWQSPAHINGCVFSGDTLHVFCGLKSVREGAARLSLRYVDGTACEIDGALDQVSTSTVTNADLPRIAAAARIREGVFEGGEEQRDELTALAVQHQIISPFTNYILVHLRGEDAAKTLPELRQVPNMLAAGWGGVGSVRDSGNVLETRVMSYPRSASLSWGDEPGIRASTSANREVMFRLADEEVESSVHFSRNALYSQAEVPRPPSPMKLILALNATFTIFNPEKRLARTLNEPNGLVGIPVPVDSDLIDDLRLLIKQGWSEEEVLIAFWLAMLSTAVVKHFARQHRRAILRAARQTPVAAELLQWMTASLMAITDTAWSWAPSSNIPVARVESSTP